eukprot:Anaeramoba_ignava/c21383_g1_i1.p1 GENE.c21383_g1_i1~~c21383_g1_i1.p1  ORF type:complete len:356 (-),score=114.27 c21383_g1_i1:18-1085(-)
MITTYSMISFQGNRSEDSKEIMQEIQNKDWGLLVLDEVHVVPAETFRKTISIAKSHVKLGLTATLVREDERIADLNFLIGPKLYEANWQDLQRNGYIAKVQCAEVWCPMTTNFFNEYLKSDSVHRKILLFVMNPSKIQACEYLIRYHESCGDKILIFSDSVYALLFYSKKLNKPKIYGKTTQNERMEILTSFQNNVNKCIFISRVGDNSIDLPDANVIIQISSHYGSRRQEAQRLGRILRPKPSHDNPNEFSAFFYTLVSQDTQEMYYSTKRQQFLIDQGYSFKVISNLIPEDNLKDLCFSKKEDQEYLLEKVLKKADDKEEDEEDFDAKGLREIKKREKAKTIKKRKINFKFRF